MLSNQFCLSFVCLCVNKVAPKEVVNRPTIITMFLSTCVHENGRLPHMWQSRIEIEYYSVVYFECITEFDVL